MWGTKTQEGIKREEKQSRFNFLFLSNSLSCFAPYFIVFLKEGCFFSILLLLLTYSTTFWHSIKRASNSADMNLRSLKHLCLLISKDKNSEKVFIKSAAMTMSIQCHNGISRLTAINTSHSVVWVGMRAVWPQSVIKKK